jgi:hypothetical protein
MSHTPGALRRSLLIGGLVLGLVPASAGAHALSFQLPSSTVPESAGSLPITITRTGSGTTPNVSYRVAPADPGTATNGADYTGISGTLTFGPNEHARTLTLPILDDALIEGDETVRLELHDAGPAGDGHLGTYPRTTVTIADDDSTTQFAARVYRVDEAEGHATIGVTRSGMLAGTDTVDYATADGSARAGEDYAATSGTLTFADREGTRSFDVPLVPDTDDEDEESVVLALSDPGPAGTHIGTPGLASLMIADDDITPEPPVLTYIAPPPAAPIVVALARGMTAARLARTGALTVVASCPANCILRAGARFGPGRRGWSARSAARAGTPTRLSVRLTARRRATIRLALARHRSVPVWVTIAARSRDGAVRRVGRALRLRR